VSAQPCCMASTASWTEVDEPRTITGTCGWLWRGAAVMPTQGSGPSFCETNAAARFARSSAASAPDSVETERVAKPTDSSAATTGLASTPLGTASRQVRPEPQLLVLGMRYCMPKWHCLEGISGAARAKRTTLAL